MAKRYGGKTDGAIQVSISKKSAKDTRYFEVVYDEKKQKDFDAENVKNLGKLKSLKEDTS